MQIHSRRRCRQWFKSHLNIEYWHFGCKAIGVVVVFFCYAYDSCPCVTSKPRTHSKRERYDSIRETDKRKMIKIKMFKRAPKVIHRIGWTEMVGRWTRNPVRRQETMERYINSTWLHSVLIYDTCALAQPHISAAAQSRRIFFSFSRWRRKHQQKRWTKFFVVSRGPSKRFKLMRDAQETATKYE